MFPSVKGHIGPVWDKIINTMGASTIAILPKCFWKTDFFSREASDWYKYGSISLDSDLFCVTQFCLVKWEERFAESFWDCAFSLLGEIQRRSAFLSTVGHKQGSMKPSCFHFTTMKEISLRLKPTDWRTEKKHRKNLVLDYTVKLLNQLTLEPYLTLISELIHLPIT